jgi:anti-sigma B factor antagonist
MERHDPSEDLHDAPRGEVRVLALVGELDDVMVPSVRYRLDALIKEGHSDLVIDLLGVTLLTSSVVNVLFAAAKRLRASGCRLAVVCVDPNVRRVLELTALDRAAEVCESEQAARAALAARRL